MKVIREKKIVYRFGLLIYHYIYLIFLISLLELYYRDSIIVGLRGEIINIEEDNI